jgi:hypothetical protein
MIYRKPSECGERGGNVNQTIDCPENRNWTETAMLQNKVTQLSEFRPRMDLKEPEAEDAHARRRIAALEEKGNQHSHVIAMLRCFRTKSLSSAQILGVLLMKFQSFDLSQPKFNGIHRTSKGSFGSQNSKCTEAE